MIVRMLFLMTKQIVLFSERKIQKIIPKVKSVLILRKEKLKTVMKFAVQNEG